MKAKVKLNGGALKEAFVKHIEKILFAVVALCFVWLVYSAMNVERYTKTPDELVNVSSNARNHLDTRVFNPTSMGTPPETVFQPAKPIDTKQASADWHVFMPASKAQQRRKQPKVFAPTALRAQAGIGAIATAADAVTQLRRQKEQMERAEVEAEKARRDMEKGQPAEGNARYGQLPPTGRGTGREGGVMPPGAGGTGRPTGRPGGTGRPTGRPGEGGMPFGTGMPLTGAPVVDEEPIEVPLVPTTPDMLLKGSRWVCITGLVPGKKQYDEFKKAAGPDFPLQELPQYVWFEVQRAEFKPGKQVADTDWQDVDVMKALKGMQQWGTQYPEISDPKYVHPSLSMPLPPLVTRNWGGEVVHAPEVEKLDLMAQQDALVALQQQIEDAKKQAEEAKAQGGEGSESTTPGPTPDPTATPQDDWDTITGGGGYGGGGYGGSRSQYGGRPGETGRPQSTGQFTTGRPPMMGPSMMGPTLRMGEGAGMMTSLDMTPPDHFLLRFFDFSVDSGKSYVYRIRLRMRNPNWMMPPTQLENSSLKDERFILGDWSAVTDAARVPGDTALVVGEPKLNKSTMEPEAKVVVARFNADKGVMTTVEEKVSRGQMANFYRKEISYIDPVLNKVEEFKDLALNTDLTVVDILGGATIGKNAAKVSPGRMLLMDAQGNFEIREELIDRTAFNSAIAEQKRIKEFEETGTLGAVPGGASYGRPMMGPGPNNPSGRGGGGGK